MKILFVVPYAPNQIRTRPLNLIKGLTAAGHRVTLATLWSDPGELQSIRALDAILDGSIAESISAASSIWNCVQALPGRRPFQFCYSWSLPLANRIARALKTQDFDVIHVEHLRGARYGVWLGTSSLLRGRKLPPLVWDSVDCISELFRQASRESYAFRARLISRIEYPRTARYEGWLATQFDRVLATSESDRRALLKLADEWLGRKTSDTIFSIRERISVVPNGVDLSYFSPSGEARTPKTLVITGKMSYHANVTAVVRFVEEVMPKIWSRAPQVQLWIAGRNPAPEIRKLGVPFPAASNGCGSLPGNGKSRILITGTVEDLRPYLRKASVAVAPVRYGAGIQNKVLEAMACGTPVVATPEAIGALQVQPGQDLVVSKDGQKMADAILSLLDDPEQCRRVGKAGRAFVEANHDWSRITQALVHLYRNAGIG